MEKSIEAVDGRSAPAAPPSEGQPSPEEEKRNLLARLLAQLAHEIRNPLSSLDIHVQLLEEDLGVNGQTLQPKTQERFHIIRGEIRRLENVVRRFLQLAGPSALDVAPISLNTIVHQAFELLQPDAQEQGVELRSELADELPIMDADAVQLSQAIINLIINALQAAGRDGHVIIQTRFDPGVGTVLSITDDGPGIPTEDHARIFEPYYTTKSDGSGLGLWITQQIVFAHGGRLTVDSAQGRGASFRVVLPRTRV